MRQELDVRLDEGAESGLAAMLRDLIVQNLERRPERLSSFRKLRSSVWIRAEDSDVSVTLQFSEGGHLVISDGERGIGEIRVVGDSDAIVALSALRLRRGVVPDPLAPATRRVLKRQLGGQLTVRGLILRARQVVHLLRVLAAG